MRYSLEGFQIATKNPLTNGEKRFIGKTCPRFQWNSESVSISQTAVKSRLSPRMMIVSHRAAPAGMMAAKNNYRTQYVRKSSVGLADHGPCATAPSGGIEPRSPYKPWPNPKKTAVSGSTGNGGWYTSIEPQHG